MRQKNVWIISCIAGMNFIRATWSASASLVTGRKSETTHSYETLNNMITEGPEIFHRDPTAIKIGRAPFSFLLRFFRLYESHIPSDTHQ